MSRNDVLVDADWVEAHLDDPKVVLVEVDEDTTAYEKGHIRGAVRVDWREDLQDPVRRDFIDKAGFEKLLSAQGHRQRRHRRPLRRQQQLVRCLRVLVLQAVRPPGRPPARRRPQEVGARLPRARHRRRASARPRRYIAKEPDTSIRAFRDEVVAAIGTKNLVDVRCPDEYAGRLLAPAHLPQEQSQRRRPHPDRGEHAVVQGGQRRRHVQVRRRAHGAVRGRRASTWPRTPSRTAGSVSGRRTPGSCSTSCSASRT